MHLGCWDRDDWWESDTSLVDACVVCLKKSSSFTGGKPELGGGGAESREGTLSILRKGEKSFKNEGWYLKN